MSNMSDKVAEISDPTHHTSLMTSLRNFITTESFIDVQFVCQGGHKVYAHKLMLISVSSLLKKVLIENPDSNEMITIHLPDISSKLLRIVINFLYIGFMRLNSAEMDQFKMVLGLLDIEIFQKPPEQENPTNVSSDPLGVANTSNNNYNNNNNISANNNNSVNTSGGTQNNVFYGPSGVTLPPNVVTAASIPVGSRMCPPQNVPAEYVPVAQASTHVAGVPVDNGPQYITIRTDQLGIQNNRGEVMVSYSAVPIHHTSNAPMVVQHNTHGLPTGHQTMLQDQNQFNTFTSNVITSPVSATHVTSNAVSSNLVPVNSIAQVPASQVNVQHVSTVQAGGQQMVRLVPPQQNQTVVNNVSYSNTSSETTGPVSTNPQLNNKGSKRKSSHNYIRPMVQASTGSSDVVIDLSDDDGTDYQKPVKPMVTPTSRPRVKIIKNARHSSGGATSSGTLQSPSSSSSSSQSVPRNTSVSHQSGRIKRKKDGAIVEVDLEETKVVSSSSNVFNRTP